MLSSNLEVSVKLKRFATKAYMHAKRRYLFAKVHSRYNRREISDQDCRMTLYYALMCRLMRG